MRHPLAATAVLSALFLTLTACSGDSSGGTTAGAPAPAAGSAAAPASPAPVDPAVAKSADAALTGNTKAICAQATRVGTDFGKIFVDDLKLKIDAASQGAEAKAKAQEKINRDVQNYSYALADMAKLTTDAPLKKALARMSKQVKALKGDVTKINADKMSALSATLDKACGKG